MRAVVQDSYGPPDVLELREVDRPALGSGDVLVRVHAAGIDQGVWHLMAGLPYVVRLAGYGIRSPKNPVRGLDVAGRVEQVGTQVTRFEPGDEVFGTCDGSFAEYARTSEDRLARKPANLGFEQAAAVPTSGYAALQAVRDHGQVTAGQRVLVIGAGGGVGTFAVQIAKAYGARVTGVASTAKIDLIRSIGADAVIDYTVEEFADRPERYDVILDVAGNRPLSRLRRALTPQGDARDRRRGGRRKMARRRRPPAPRAPALAVRRPDAPGLLLERAPGGPRGAAPAHRGRRRRTRRRPRIPAERRTAKRSATSAPAMPRGKTVVTV